MKPPALDAAATAGRPPPLARFDRRLVAVYGRYLAVSVAALGVDTALYLALLHAGLIAGAAAALGYLAGAVLHWCLATAFIFRADDDRRRRRAQFAQYLLSGVVGLLITSATVHALVAGLGADTILAKIAAIAVSFNVVFVLRKTAIFRNATRID